MWGNVLWSFAMVSNVDRTMVYAHLRKCSIDIDNWKIIWDFPRLLKGVGTSRVGEEEGTCTIHKFLPFIQQLWHSIAIHPNSCCIVKLFHTVMKNCIYLWETTWKPKLITLRAIGGCKLNVYCPFIFGLHIYCLKRLGLNYGLRWYQYSLVTVTALAWILVSVSSHIHTRVPRAENRTRS